MKRDILRFTGMYEYLSNFYMRPVSHDGIIYPSNEHAYQAAKDFRTAIRERIAGLPTAGSAKRAGRGKIDLRTEEEVKLHHQPLVIELRSDWDAVKDQIMYDICREKFLHNRDLKEALLVTGGLLVEGNDWGDTYWGMCGGIGQNKLGLILMRIRTELS